MKLIWQVVGVIALLALFAITYGLTAGLKQNKDNPVALTDFTSDTQTVGEVGGFHILYDLDWKQEDGFYRIKLFSRLNRSSLLDTIATPQTTARFSSYASKPAIELAMSDTNLNDPSNPNSDDPTFIDPLVQDIYQGVLGQIVVDGNSGGELQKVWIVTDAPAKFRLQTDPQDPSIVWLDVLK